MKAYVPVSSFEGFPVYERMMEILLGSGNPEDLHDLVHPNFSGFGSAAHEVFNSPDDVIGMARKQLEQFSNMHIDIRRNTPRGRRINASTYSIVEEFLFSFDGGHELSLRVSTILSKAGARWLVSHLHGSSPDTDIAEEEAFPDEGLRKRNRELEVKIAERTRELEVEAALERVRSRTMAMQNSNELQLVIQEVYDQFKYLGFNVDHSGFILDYKERDDMHIWLADPNGPFEITFPYFESPHWNSFLKARKEGASLFTNLLDLKTKNNFYTDLFERIPEIPEASREVYFKCPGLAISTVLMETVGLYIENLSGMPYAPEENEILLRFGKAFQQAYTRFQDLQKAEAQAWEARVEAALERVRARSMAMHSSDELNDVLSVFFQQFDVLDIKPVTAFLSLFDIPNNTFTYRSTSKAGNRMQTQQVVDLDSLDIWRELAEKWKNEKQDPVEVIHYPAEVLPELFKLLEETFSAMPESERLSVADFPEGGYAVQGYCKFGYIGYNHHRPPTEEEKNILIRFSREFARLYQRFLDVKKAEAQAREAEIQLALERVRARAMAMHKSEELAGAAELLYDQLGKLGIEPWTCGYVFLEEGNPQARVWMTEPDGKFFWGFWTVPVDDDPILRERHASWRLNEKIHHRWLRGAENIEHHKYILGHAPVSPEARAEFLSNVPESLLFTSVHFGYGYLAIITTAELSSEQTGILTRFAEVFRMTYTRFLDLEKAEAQAREAKIEMALERIRAQVTAMRESTELLDIVVTMRGEFVRLGHEAHYFWHMRWLPDRYEKAMTSGDGTRIGNVMELPRHMHGDIPELAAWESGKAPTLVYTMDAEAAIAYVDKMVELGDFQQVDPQAPSHDDIRNIGGLTFVMARTTHGEIGYSLPGVVPNPSSRDLETLVRFAGVFDLAYRRFEDLKKAEGQKREAEIELALERVRARAMAMQHSDELQDAAMELFRQLDTLGVPLFACGFNIWDDDRKFATAWMARKDRFQPPFKTESSKDVFARIYEAAEKGVPLFVEEQRGKALQEHYEYMASIPTFGEILAKMKKQGLSTPEAQVLHCPFFSHGYLMFISFEPVPEAHDIFRRFAVVFEQTYTRFLDLQKAEAQTREARVEAALEKVRARTMAMQHSDELAEASHVLDQQVRGLGIETWGCAFQIYRENDSMEWFSSEAGLMDAYPLPWEGIFKRYYEEGQKGKKLYRDSFEGEACRKHYEYMCTLPVLGELLKGILAAGGSFPTQQYDYVAYFKYGHVLFITLDPVGPEVEKVFVRFAEVFDQTYTRFLDLELKERQAVALNKEKQRLEITLKDLQSTQKQLIHAEKMASLGELTAGIAHEIQNPLNFVNNFSEVSRELLEELLEEMKNGDTTEAGAIARDVIENMDKIVHHGKRADGIVKGMLQHSRAGDGKKELTDLNKLADEYLRLAYHGMRAKDKGFNAALETEFDPELPRVNVVPQDIGRVLLNLLTNAFHAVSDRKAQISGDYEPTVWVVTRSTADGIEITVRDNGNGIPEAMRDKIFQPFFTTKAAGQGTGLGLSLSYDIVTKGHRGTLKVESQVGKGTEFIVNLPV